MRVRLRWIAVLLIAASAGLTAYYRDLLAAALTANPIAATPESIARGARLFRDNCAVCHGAGGRGDGPAAANLGKRPKDLARIAPPPIFPDGVVAYRIANGGDVMPAWKAVLSERDIWDLLNFIRSLAAGGAKT